jgi:sarcosine oxidase / L-pipecolate oxidase
VLRSVIQAAVNLGVNYVEATVAKIAFDASGTCLGVETAAGDIFTSKHAVLCTGARTAELIAESAPEKAELQVNGRMTAAAAIMCVFRVPENQLDKFKNAPIIVSPMGSTPGSFIGFTNLILECWTHNNYRRKHSTGRTWPRKMHPRT